jgi:hypothetical protein
MTRNNYKLLLLINITKGYAVAQLVEELHYGLEGHMFDSQLGRWDFSLSCTMAFGLTQPPTEMNTRDVAWR